MPAEVPALTVANAVAWRQWLSREASKSLGVWLTLAKKGTTTPTSLTMDEATEEALCFGWINGQGRKRDEYTLSQRFTPRKGRSAWSKRNVGIVERLEAEGRMTEGGRAAVGAAKADGRWEAAYDATAASAPPDLLEAIDASGETAKATWEGLNSQNRYAIYFRLIALKTKEGREKRIRAFVEMLAKGETPVPQKEAVKTTTTEENKIRAKRSAAPETVTSSTRVEKRTRSGRNVPSYSGQG